MAAFSIFLNILFTEKKIHQQQNAREAIRGAIHETRLFKARRNVSDPGNVYLCTNEECAHVARAWALAMERILEIGERDFNYLECKIEFWTNEELRARDGYHVQNPGAETPTLEEIERIFTL